MAGEYYRWLARDVKPEEKRELTREEKMKNWWHYHKWHLLIAAVVLILVLDVAQDILTQKRNQPDYTIAYIGSSYLPEDTVSQLTEALAQMGEDLNGNGGVQVDLRQYIVYPPDTEETTVTSTGSNMLYYAQVQLAADLETCESLIFLMENPDQFQEDYQILVYPDGSFPEETDGGNQPLYYAWSDCPVLKGLPLGNFQADTMNAVYTGASQDVLSALYIGRRGFWQANTPDNLEGCEALWLKLIQGA